MTKITVYDYSGLRGFLGFRKKTIYMAKSWFFEESTKGTPRGKVIILEDETYIFIPLKDRVFLHDKALHRTSPEFQQRVRDNKLKSFTVKSRYLNGKCVYSEYTFPYGFEQKFVMEDDTFIESFVNFPITYPDRFKRIHAKMEQESGQAIPVNK